MEKNPSLLVTVRRSSPAATAFVSTTVALGITAPEASETVPVRVPLVLWALRAVFAISKAQTGSAIRQTRLRVFNMEIEDSTFWATFSLEYRWKSCRSLGYFRYADDAKKQQGI